MDGKKGRGQPRAQWSENVQGWLEMKVLECKQKAESRKDCAMIANLRDGEET